MWNREVKECFLGFVCVRAHVCVWGGAWDQNVVQTSLCTYCVLLQKHNVNAHFDKWSNCNFSPHIAATETTVNISQSGNEARSLYLWMASTQDGVSSVKFRNVKYERKDVYLTAVICILPKKREN